MFNSELLARAMQHIISSLNLISQDAKQVQEGPAAMIRCGGKATTYTNFF
jgi:hypothetical protein